MLFSWYPYQVIIIIIIIVVVVIVITCAVRRTLKSGLTQDELAVVLAAK